MSTPPLPDSENLWDRLIRSINRGMCTPFLGAGACAPWLPLGRTIAEELARECHYPFDDRDLPTVSAYIALQHNPDFVKQLVVRRYFADIPYPQTDDPRDPHNVLADLPLPLYMTTNYDDAMSRALRARGKFVSREWCRWTPHMRARDGHEASLSPDNPMVFHLHGHSDEPNSLVLTEDDYLMFLVALTGGRADLIPLTVQVALAENILLFVGYSLNDTNLRVILRRLAPLRRCRSILVQPAPRDSARMAYIAESLSKTMNVDVLWSKGNDFALQLHKRWTER